MPRAPGKMVVELVIIALKSMKASANQEERDAGVIASARRSASRGTTKRHPAATGELTTGKSSTLPRK